MQTELTKAKGSSNKTKYMYCIIVRHLEL